jgi:hypothetical protein
MKPAGKIEEDGRKALVHNRATQMAAHGFGDMAGLATDLVQVFRTGRANHWEFLRLWTGFELSSSWRRLPCYGASANRNILDFMRWPQIDLRPQDLNDLQRPKSFQKNSWK